MARTERRLRVDWIRCDGYGVCGDVLPDLIDLDDWRHPILRSVPVPSDLLHDAQRAVDCCPVKALILERVSSTGGDPRQHVTDASGRRRHGGRHCAPGTVGPGPRRGTGAGDRR